jgi:hypothetical protein
MNDPPPPGSLAVSRSRRRVESAAKGPAPDHRLGLKNRLAILGPSGWILIVLVGVGVAIRIVAFTAWWPASTTLADAIPYSVYAEADPLGDPQHPVGYPGILALLGFVSRELALVIIVQHLLGISTALVLFAAVRRMVSSPWPALVPAAVVLLSADVVFLEHTIMSESFFLATLAIALYASVRATQDPEPWWRWPVLAAALIVLAGLTRSAALFLLPVLLLAMPLARPRYRRSHLRAPLAAGGVAVLLLIGYAFANLSGNGRFEVGPTQGWHLYGRVAPFADCSQITPPDGTEDLCEATDPSQRPGGDFYLYIADSPAQRAYGREPWRKHDDDLGAWARQVIIHQPLTYAREMWRDVKTYFVPSVRVPRNYSGGDLDAELDWTVWYPGSARSARQIEAGMETFFEPFNAKRNTSSLEFLHDYQRFFRVGATLLVLASLLTLLGLFVGPRRHRVGVFLFGIGGLAMLVGPTVSVYAIGRYTVPISPLIAAGGAITLLSLWRMEAGRRSAAAAS